MALRSPEVRAAYETVKKDKAAQRKARKAEAIKHVQAWAKSTLPNAKDKRQRDPAFLAFLRRQPCAAGHLGGCSGPIEAAHIRYSCVAAGARNPGMQAKNHDRHCNPLCRGHHHHDQHPRRERDFWAAVGVDAYENAARLYARFLAGDAEPSPSIGPTKKAARAAQEKDHG